MIFIKSSTASDLKNELGFDMARRGCIICGTDTQGGVTHTTPSSDDTSATDDS